MADKYKMLRGAAALTVVRGTPGRHVYRNEVVDPRSVYPQDQERLVAEGFLEWVVKDGDNYTLAEDGASSEKGDSVTVGTTSADVSPDAQRNEGADPADPGLTNTPAPVDAEATAAAKADAELAEKRAAAKAKLPEDGSAPDGRAGQPVWVEYLVTRGSRYEDVAKADKDELVKLAKQQA
jgi:hypothetical protein